mgnify:CR=1 FL=1
MSLNKAYFHIIEELLLDNLKSSLKAKYDEVKAHFRERLRYIEELELAHSADRVKTLLEENLDVNS